jgi:hypothetical protein
LTFPRIIPPAPYGPPLALKLCAGCATQWAVEGDVGDGQGGLAWFCPRCEVPEHYLDQYIREGSRQLDEETA